MKKYLLLIGLIAFIGCSKDDGGLQSYINTMYFPPVSGSWESISPELLGWNTSNLADLYTYLSEKDTRAFIILKNGRIVVEKYWGNNILDTGPFTLTSQWYWASAGKSVVACLVGIAQQEDSLSIDDKTSDYLGTGWTSLTPEKEDLITIRHQLTMTTGLDYTVADLDCTDPACLLYSADAGTQWFYHNAPYTLLHDVLSVAYEMDFKDVSSAKLESKIGMYGNWFDDGNNEVFWSIPRNMARFGLLVLNEGEWDGEQIIEDEVYFEEMTNSSQALNPSYGYLWWLNGKSSIIYPGLALSFNTEFAPNAPDDMIAAAGKNGQFAEVIPSRGLVVIRMGEAPDGSQVPIAFHNEMWEKISAVIGE